MITAIDQAELDLATEIESFAHDPLGFVEFAFPWGVKGGDLELHSGPRKWQREVLGEVGARLRANDARGAAEVIQEAIASGHGIGKSAFLAWIALWSLSTREDTKGVITANTEKQLHTKTAPEIAKWHRMLINTHWFRLTTTAIYSADPAHEKTWRFDLVPWSENNTEAFAGLHNEGKRLVLIFDEASSIADKVWEVAEGALTDANTEIFWFAFGNPTRPSGRFRECFRRFKHRWLHRHIDARTVEGTNKEQIAKMVADYGEDSDTVKVRVRGMFPSQAAKQFISEAIVDKAYGRFIKPGSFEWAPKILTLDPAWEGDDEICFGLRQGLTYRELLNLPKNDDDVWIANKLAEFEDEFDADMVFIDAGGGGVGISHIGNALGRTWVIVWFGGGAAIDGYLNKRAEMYGSTRDWLRKGGCLPKDPQLHTELTTIETVARLDGKTQLESKKDMKKRGLPSPGRADALALSFAFPVSPRDRSVTRASRGKVLNDYNPFAEEAFATT